MSPEQLSGEVSDARTDVWAAGAVLYEMATGKRPFAQSVPALLINAILNQPPVAPSTVNPEVPAALDAVIMKSIARDRAQRYKSAAALGLDLEKPPAVASGAAPAVRRLPAYGKNCRIRSATCRSSDRLADFLLCTAAKQPPPMFPLSTSAVRSQCLDSRTCRAIRRNRGFPPRSRRCSPRNSVREISCARSRGKALP